LYVAVYRVVIGWGCHVTACCRFWLRVQQRKRKWCRNV